MKESATIRVLCPMCGRSMLFDVSKGEGQTVFFKKCNGCDRTLSFADVEQILDSVMEIDDEK